MSWSRRAVLFGGAACAVAPAVAQAAFASRLVAVHLRGAWDPHRILDPLDGPTIRYGAVTLGLDDTLPEALAFFEAHIDRVAVLRGLDLGTADPQRGRWLALSGRPDKDQPDLVNRLGRAVDLGSEAAGNAWRLGRRLSLAGWVDPARAVPDAEETPRWLPSPAVRHAMADWQVAQGRPTPIDPGRLPAPRHPDDPATLVDDALLVPELLQTFDAVRIVGPDPEVAPAEVWSGLDALLTALAATGWLDTTLVLVTADRGRDTAGVLAGKVATLAAGGPVRGGQVFDAGAERSRGWPELAAGALAACGRYDALPGVVAWTAWWS